MRKLLVLAYKKIKKFFSGYGLSNFYVIRAAHNFIVSCLKSRFAIVHGHKMFLDPRDSLMLSLGEEYEPLATAVVKKLVKKGDTILDIGANIGYYTLLFAKLAGENGRVFAFEPEPENFSILKKNIEANGYQNVVLVQKAVFDKNEKIKLYLRDDNRGDHRIYDSGDGRQTIEITSVRLDDYFKNHNGKIDFIKMDIQGAEGAALSGMRNLLKENNPIMLTEFWPFGIQRFGMEAQGYLNMLQNCGFESYFLNDDKKKIEKITNSELFEKYTPENKRYANLLCIKNMATKDEIINEITKLSPFPAAKYKR